MEYKSCFEIMGKDRNSYSKSLKTSIIISAMMDRNQGISGQEKGNRMDIHRRLKWMGVQTAVDAHIRRNVYINIMPKKMQRKTRS